VTAQDHLPVLATAQDRLEAQRTAPDQAPWNVRQPVRRRLIEPAVRAARWLIGLGAQAARRLIGYAGCACPAALSGACSPSKSAHLLTPVLIFHDQAAFRIVAICQLRRAHASPPAPPPGRLPRRLTGEPRDAHGAHVATRAGPGGGSQRVPGHVTGRLGITSPLLAHDRPRCGPPGGASHDHAGGWPLARAGTTISLRDHGAATITGPPRSRGRHDHGAATITGPPRSRGRHDHGAATITRPPRLPGRRDHPVPDAAAPGWGGR
jgi:hypothetical protein